MGRRVNELRDDRDWLEMSGEAEHKAQKSALVVVKPIRQLEKCTILDFSNFQFCICTLRSGGMIQAYSRFQLSKLVMMRILFQRLSSVIRPERHVHELAT